jgi:glycosyltransferase involved in cell wall biosynthesis
VPPTATTRPHRVLVLAYHFPPHGGGGVQRTLKLVKYLPRHGFDPIVVTSRPGGYPLRDATLHADVPAGTVILRAPSAPTRVARWKAEGLLRRLGLSVRPAAMLGWPDEMVGWLPGAAYQALRAVRRYRPDVLLSTAWPVTAHVAALAVHRLTGLPWVADFRDPWSLNPHVQRSFAPLARASAALERQVTSRAAAAVVVDESVELLGIEPGDPRLVIVRNGVDGDDLPAPAPAPAGDRFRLSYVGSLYGSRDAAPVLAAVRGLAATGSITPGTFELRLVGDASIAGDHDMDGIPITRTGYVDHVRALREMAAASALLFYAPAGSRGSSGKIYEYLASGRPVLCVASRDSLARRLVEDLGAGPCIDPGDADGIRVALERLMGAWRDGSLAIDPAVREEALRRFSRDALAGQLATVLRATIADGQEGDGRLASKP